LRSSLEFYSLAQIVLVCLVLSTTCRGANIMLSQAKDFADPISRDGLRAMSQAAHAANRRAHSLTGPGRAKAFSRKVALLSALITAGAARVNGVGSDNIVGIDLLLNNPPSRLHCPVHNLSAEARAIVRRQCLSAPAVAPLCSRMDAAQIQALRDCFGKHPRKRS